jgi:hypothetical protein
MLIFPSLVRARARARHVRIQVKKIVGHRGRARRRKHQCNKRMSLPRSNARADCSRVMVDGRTVEELGVSGGFRKILGTGSAPTRVDLRPAIIVRSCRFVARYPPTQGCQQVVYSYPLGRCVICPPRAYWGAPHLQHPKDALIGRRHRQLSDMICIHVHGDP